MSDQTCGVPEECICGRCQDAPGSKSAVDSLVMRRLRDALTIMDERGRHWPDNSRGLWDDEWDELRMLILSARNNLGA